MRAAFEAVTRSEYLQTTESRNKARASRVAWESFIKVG